MDDLSIRFTGDRWDTRIVHAGCDTRRVTRVTIDPDAAYPSAFPDNNEWKACGRAQRPIPVDG